MATLEQATAALGALRDAGSGRSLLELGWIEQPRLQDDRLIFRLSLPAFAQSQQGRIAAEAREAALAIEGIRDVRRSGPPAMARPPAPAASCLRASRFPA
jgi:ATP-binding protein involved in chromosome partitioning